MRTLPGLVGLIALAALTTTACGDEPEPHPCYHAPGEIDAAGLHYRYVMDSVDLPSSFSEAQAYGMVLDCNTQGRPNNAFGQVLSSVFNFIDSDIDESVQTAIDDGRVLHLLEVQATSLDDAAGVGAQVFVGADRDDDPADNFSGEEVFDVEANHASQPLTGAVLRGRLTADLGTIPLRVVLPHVEGAFTLELEAARIETEVITATEVRGSIGGVLVEQEIRDRLLPIIHTSLQASVAIDCVDGVCEKDSQGEAYLDLFDVDGDGVLSFSEVANDTLIQSLLAPDVDIFDADGDINPGQDGIKDSLSVGAHFTARPARFTPPR